jgi:glutaminyl-tRNA synthetase
LRLIGKNNSFLLLSRIRNPSRSLLLDLGSFGSVPSCSLGIFPSEHQVKYIYFLSNTVLSKRKLHKLIFESHVQGWDDPRIFTLNGLRRRGYTAQAINEFCDSIGVTRRGNENIIPLHFLENILRK